MKVMVHQTSPVIFDVDANIEYVIERIQKGLEKKALLNVFPELALTGYFLGPRYHEAALRMDSPQIKKLAEATKGTAAIVGFIEESSSMNFYNSALVAVDGEVAYACRKLNLPNYGVFEERKYFSPGKQVRVFRFKGFAFAVLICNDLWHPSLPYLAVCQKADVFITIFNSSQGSMGDEFSNIESWGIINKFYARIFGIYNVCANRAGTEIPEAIYKEQGLPAEQQKATEEYLDDQSLKKKFNFWGGSEIVNPFGVTIAKAKQYEPDEISAEFSRDLLRRKKILLPYLRNDDPYFTHRELQRILYGTEGQLSLDKDSK